MKTSGAFAHQGWLLFLAMASIGCWLSSFSGGISLFSENAVKFHQQLLSNNITDKHGHDDGDGMSFGAKRSTEIETNETLPHSSSQNSSNARFPSQNKVGGINLTGEQRARAQSHSSQSTYQSPNGSSKYKLSEESSESSSDTVEKRDQSISAENKSKENVESVEVLPVDRINCSNTAVDEGIQLLVDFSTTVLEDGMKWGLTESFLMKYVSVL